MRTIRFINSRQDAQWSYQLTDGRLIEILNAEGQFSIKYDTPFNLQTGEIYEDKKTAPKDAVTLNQLDQLHKGKTVYCYGSFDLDLGWVRTMSARRLAKISETFRRNGFNVTPQAILHNYNAWLGNLKSGYRDEKNGYHLFTPSGCNPLSFRATTIHSHCAGWQQTYIS